MLYQTPGGYELLSLVSARQMSFQIDAHDPRGAVSLNFERIFLDEMMKARLADAHPESSHNAKNEERFGLMESPGLHP